MIRQTSIKAYEQIESEGLLSKRRFEVYQVLFEYGPMTYSEVVLHFRSRKNFATSSTYQARLSELRDFGVVQELGKTQCPVTKREVILWDVTASLPKRNRVDRYKEITNKIKRHKAVIAKLEARLRQLNLKEETKTQLFLAL